MSLINMLCIDVCILVFQTGNLLQSIMGDDGDEDSLQQSTSSDGPAPQPSSQSATLSPVELD